MTPEIKQRIEQIRRGEVPDGWTNVILSDIGRLLLAVPLQHPIKNVSEMIISL